LIDVLQAGLANVVLATSTLSEGVLDGGLKLRRGAAEYCSAGLLKVS
jgi:hypothetical protein